MYDKYLTAPKPITLKGNFKDKFIREEQQNRDRIPVQAGSLKEQMTFAQYERLMAKTSNRMLLSEKIYRDDNGSKIENHNVYKDMMIFFSLLEKDIFGGRVMIMKNHQNE